MMDGTSNRAAAVDAVRDRTWAAKVRVAFVRRSVEEGECFEFQNLRLRLLAGPALVVASR